nr:hypothetical protein [Nannocystis sp.]
MFVGGEHGVDDVGHVGEVGELLLAEADAELELALAGAAEDRRQEAGVAGAEHDVRTDGAAEQALLAVGGEHLLFGDALGLGVGGGEAGGVGQRLVAVLDVVAVVDHAGRADVDQARHGGLLAGAEHVAGAVDVDGADGLEAVVLGVHERGAVEDDVLAGDRVLDHARVADVAADELHVGAPRVDAVVEHGDDVAARGEGVDDGAAEEAAAAGDEGRAGLRSGAGGGHGRPRIDQGRRE